MNIQEIIAYHDKRNWFSIQMWLENQVVVAFRVYEMRGIQGDEIMYERADSASGVDMTIQLDQALVFCSGNIKWDGCMNLQFDEQEKNMLHFCSNPGRRFRDLMDCLYDMASKLLPDPDDYPLAA